MKHIKLFEGFNEAKAAPVQDIKTVAKLLKFPAGTTIRTDEASWYKRGGHAGTNVVYRVMENAENLGWKREFKQATHPAYDHVTNNNTLFDPAGLFKLVGIQHYGNTAADNSYSLKLSFLKRDEADIFKKPEKKQFEGLNEHFETGSPNVHLKSGHISPREEKTLENLKKDGFVKLGDDIYNVLGPNTKIELFSSGYFGLHILNNGHEFYIMDQPGHVGLEDQTMPYIVLKRGSKELIEIGPDYHSRDYGYVGMESEMRKDAYDKILQYFKDEYETITKS